MLDVKEESLINMMDGCRIFSEGHGHKCAQQQEQNSYMNKGIKCLGSPCKYYTQICLLSNSQEDNFYK